MRLAILCSGQARQHCQMLDALLVAPDCAALCETASAVLGEPVDRWWHALDARTLFLNRNAQFAIALYQIAAWQRLSAQLPQAPAVVAGYSLGEVMAWHVAGALDAADTLALVRERARLMDTCLPPAPPGQGCMALWRGRTPPALHEARAAAMRRHGIVVAIHRPGGDWVLGGPPAAMDAFAADPAIAAADLKRLPVEVPSHTALLVGAVAPFRAALARAPLHSPSMPVIAGIDGRLQRQDSDALDSLPRQLAEPLHWDWCMETLASMAVDVAIELGPGNDLARQLETELPGSVARAVDEFADAADMGQWLAAHA
ncbi:acyltransferase domain-containing protein [Nitrogeniibacter mangrovi]|uniref:Acyltransferase domain-containing protein n=1 Tax=Nitrogeniibacter mangrovi TaxID=2016596 RepID=A0A6C1B7V9_9RHOO|nr:acyltransferase domain-containing protein [Nitrogeniibacter mangrovi]QID19567.1 acyltransferase domain-containing protein [Nitrogeniibacter mangrovi]